MNISSTPSLSEVEGASPIHLGRERETALEVWKQSISMQMHLNDVLLKIRALYLTLLSAAIGAIGAFKGSPLILFYFEIEISAVMLAIFAVAPVSGIFYFVDRYWYNRLLEAAARQAVTIEKKYKIDMHYIHLGKMISGANGYKVQSKWRRHALFFVSDKKFHRNFVLRAEAKIEIIYKPVIFSAVVISLIYAFVKGVQYKHRPIPSWLFNEGSDAFHALKISVLSFFSA